MKTTIMGRILIATLLPVLLVIAIVVISARNVVYRDGVAGARESAGDAARQISRDTVGKLENVAFLQSVVASEMALVDGRNPDARHTVNGLLMTLITSNPDLYSAWFAFEPDVFGDMRGRFFKTLLRTNGGIAEIFDMSEAQLEDPAASPWYNVALKSGQVYANIDDYYDFGIGEGAIHSFTMTYPIVQEGGRVIGCVGIDMLYEYLFPMDGLAGDQTGFNMLVTREGTILYSSGGEYAGRTLWEYGIKEGGEVAGALGGDALWQGEIGDPATGERMLLCLYPIQIDHADQTIFLYRATPLSALYSGFSTSIQLIVVTGVLGMIVLTILVFLTTHSIADSVKRITDSFYRVANSSAEETLGGEHVTTYETGVVELDTLQKALVKMMMQLRSAHELKLKAVEAEVEKEKLIASAQAKTNFFAAMSHEIRTPMNAIFGIAEILLYEGGMTAEQRKCVQDIKISADSLLGIINDILDISKMETGKMELHPEHYNFRALMDNIVSLASQLTADANLNLTYVPAGSLPMCLYGDGARLRQVLLNLIGNAVKFTKEGSVTLRVFVRGETIHFDVTDTGVGIEESQIPNIFEFFKRLDTRRNREVSGTGLGLPICNSLVELMGGQIGVQSVYGKGSTFSVVIPLIPGDEKRLQRLKGGRGTHYSDDLHVLVVDDDRTNLNVSSGLLRAAHGIRCDTAISGMEAIRMIKEKDYDIIFMDHMMPEMDGVDTTRRIRQMGGRFREIPIIALTANAMIGTKRELMEEGMNDFLAKPIQSSRLQEVLDAFVAADKRLPDAALEHEADPEDERAPSGVSLIDMRLESLLKAAGIDTLVGLENIGFDEGMYLQSLRFFRETLPDTVHTLCDLLETYELAKFHIRVHGLKGSLASVGAAALAADAKRLENAAAMGSVSECRNLAPSFFIKLERFHEVLRGALPRTDESEGGVSFDQDHFNKNLRGLCEALESYNYEAVVSHLNAILTMRYDPERYKAVSQVKLLIESFEYPGAIALLRDMAG